MAILCIDFGTSSVRAAYGDSEESIPLVLERNSAIDNASIPSAICLSSDKRKIFLGTKAVLEGNRIAAEGHYEASPKRYLGESNFNCLQQPMFSGCALSRETLIAAFVAYAGHRCKLAVGNAHRRKPISEFRISHPVFAGAHRGSIKEFYRRLERLVSGCAGQEISEEVSVDALNTWSMKWLHAVTKPSGTQGIDVEEPIAAALQLVKKPKTNQIGRTLVVDVGAGTVDFVTFTTITPARDSDEHRVIMYPAHEPTSIWKAGDEIDRILLGVIKKKLGSTFSSKSVRIINEIRIIKQRIFNESSIIYEGIRLTLAELEKEPAFIEMIKEIRDEVLKKLQSIPSEGTIVAADRKLTFVFSGGGAAIKAIRTAVYKAAQEANEAPAGKDLPESEIDQAALRGYGVDANPERLAVAMGGAKDARDWARSAARTPKISGLSGQKFKPKS